MLVLSRKIGETIVIGEDISITVLAFRGNGVRLGITAPKDVGVDRLEVSDKIANAARTQLVVEIPLDAVPLAATD